MAEVITLTNPETAALYEAVACVDQFVHVQKAAGESCYRGMISAITPEAAGRYVRWGGNLLKAKAPVKKSAVAAIAALVDEEVLVKKRNKK